MGNGVGIKLDAKGRRLHQLRRTRRMAQNLIEGSTRKRPKRNILLRAYASGNVPALASPRRLQLGGRKLPRRRI